MSLIISAILSQPCLAKAQFWNGTTTTGTGPLVGGDGSWDTAPINWSDFTGATHTAWLGNAGTFAATAGTVTLLSTQPFSELTFSTTGYFIGPNTQQLNASASAIIESDPGVTATIASIISGAGDIHINGPGETGTLILTGTTTVPATNTFFVDAGTLSLAGNGTISGGKTISIGETTNNCNLTMNGSLTSMSSSATGSTQALSVGNFGSNNSLSIFNGAQVAYTTNSTTNTGTVIGNNAGSTLNSVTVSGAGSQITDNRVFYVGLSGDHNSLSILNGGQVVMSTGNGNFVVGNKASSVFNTLLIDGANSALNVGNAQTVVIGDLGNNNSATISNGGVLTSNKDGRIGNNSNNNSVTVTGAGSLWQVTGSPAGTLYVGLSGANNTLSILKGGAVTATTQVILGKNFGANGNSIILDGVGSSLTIGINPGPFPNPDLFIGLVGLSNSVTITNGATLTAASGIEIAFAPFISSGTLNIGTGGAPGTVNALFVSGGSGQANLIFNHNSPSYVFAPPLANNLSVMQIGPGTTTLIGFNPIPSTLQTGPTTITNGTLQGGVANVFSPLSTYTVQYGGTLSLGGFNQSTGPLNNSGIVTFSGLNAGVSLSVNGDYNQSALGTYITKINSAGQSDLMTVTGTANLAGTLNVVPSFGYSLYTPYQLIHANVSRTGFFNTVTSSNPLIISNVIYFPNDVFIFFQQNLVAAAQTCNEIQVATALDSITNPTGDALVVLNALANLPVDTLQSTLNTLAGEQYTYLIQMERYGCERFNRSVFNSIRSTISPCWCPNPCNPVETWFQVNGGQAFTSHDHNSNGLTDSNVDFSLGGFTSICDGFVAGVAATYEFDYIRFHRGSRTTNWNTALGSLYGTYQNEMGYAFADFICGGSWGQFKRNISFSNIQRTAKCTPSTVQGTINLEVGANWCWCQTLFQPFVGVEFGFYNHNKISERGSDSLNLHIKSRSWNTVDTYLGTHVSGNWDCLTINADLAWQHCFNTLTGRIQNSFQNSSTFDIDGVRIGKNAIVGAVNVSAEVYNNFTLYGELSGEGWRNWSSYNFAIGIMTAW